MEGCNATIKRQVVEFEQRQSRHPPFSALWAARLLSTQSGKHLVLICKLFGLSNFWIISSHPAFWLTAKLLIFPERDVPSVGNLLGRSLSITAGTFTALLVLSIWIHSDTESQITETQITETQIKPKMSTFYSPKHKEQQHDVLQVAVVAETVAAQ